MIFLALFFVGCGDPPQESEEVSFSEEQSFSADVDKTSLKSARKDLKQAKKDVKCIKSFLQDQKRQQAGDVEPDWSQPTIEEYENNDCNCLAPLLR